MGNTLKFSSRLRRDLSETRGVVLFRGGSFNRNRSDVRSSAGTARLIQGACMRPLMTGGVPAGCACCKTGSNANDESIDESLQISFEHQNDGALSIMRDGNLLL